MSELAQYKDKNIPDAYSWMDVTESALKQVNSILTNMYDYCVQGASDSYELEDRQTIIDTLKQFKDFIYKQQLNSDYAGRYVFSGYRTDTQMLFSAAQKNQTYTITEPQLSSQITSTKFVYGGAEYTQGTSADSYANMAPELLECNKVTLSYDNLDATNDVTISYVDANGVQQTVTATTMSVATEPQNIAYNMDANGVGASGVVFIPETGELIIGDDLYDSIRAAGDFSVQYKKTEFTTDNVRPEHYFDCEVYDAGTNETKIYSNPSGQKINYQVNFSQSLTVNTLGCDSVSLGIGRMIDKIIAAAEDLSGSNEDLAAIEKLIAQTGVDDVDANGNNVLESLNELKSQIETEIVLKNTILQEAFGESLTGIKGHQSQINTSLSDLGARYKRLQLTEAKLKDLQVSYEELLSENEDVDIGEAFIKYTEADLLYQASLSATSKLLGNSLLDFI